MVFASSDVASLLHRWEFSEYVSEGFVIVGCAGELVADFFTRLPENIRKQIGTWSTIVLILALTIGLKCLIRTNELSGSVIGSLGDKAAEADRKAEKAISDSSAAFSQATDALTRAGKAEESLGKAENEAKSARTTASSALILAQGARTEADSFEHNLGVAQNQLTDLSADIVKESATRKELADALSPRELWIIGYTDKTSNIDKLKALSGMKAFIEVIPDFEAETAASELSHILKASCWQVVTNISPDPETILPGVEVDVSLQPDNKDGTDSGMWHLAMFRAETLEAFLLQNNWEENFGWSERGEMGLDSIKIRVGYKPNPYFQDSRTKELEKKSRTLLISKYGFDSTGKTEGYRKHAQPGRLSDSIRCEQTMP